MKTLTPMLGDQIGRGAAVEARIGPQGNLKWTPATYDGRGGSQAAFVVADGRRLCVAFENVRVV